MILQETVHGSCIFDNSIQNLNDFTYGNIDKFIDNNLRRADEFDIASVKPVPKTMSYFNYFSFRIIRLWNALEAGVKRIELSENGTNVVFQKKC